MSRIREYLEEGRAGKVYDPEQGMYMDPNTGQAFVPTFTNQPDSDINKRVQQGMGQDPNQGPGAYLIKDQPGPGAIPDRSGKPQAPDTNDPWAMAQEHMKSPQSKMELFQKMFPGRDPQAGFNSEQERSMYFKGLQSYRNALVDRFKWEIDRRDKKEADARKGAARRVSQQELMKQIGELTQTYREANEAAKMGPTPDQIPYEDPAKQAEDDIFNRLQSIEKRFGGEWDRGAEGGMPVEKGTTTGKGTVTSMEQRLDDKPQETTIDMGPGIKESTQGAPSAPSVFMVGEESSGKQIREYGQGKEGAKSTAYIALNIREQLRRQNPDWDSKRIGEEAKKVARKQIPKEYSLDPEKFKKLLDKAFSNKGVKETRQAISDTLAKHHLTGLPTVT